MAADGPVETADYRDSQAALPHGYDVQGRVKSIGNVGDGTIPFSATYSYLKNGNVRDAQFRQPGTAHAHERYRYRNTYDALSRLTVANYSYYSGGWNQTGTGGNFDLPGITYDKNGNLLTLKRRNGSSVLSDDLSYTYASGTNRLASVTDGGGFAGWDAAAAASSAIAYDAVGNLTTFDADPYRLTGITYDERNLPTALTAGGTTVQYRYSASGQRTYKKEGTGSPEYYVLDGSVTLAVVDGGSPQFWNVLTPSGETIGRHLASGGRRYYRKDHLGSVRAVVAGNGSVQETRDYYPFGLMMPGRETTEATGAKEDYTGHERDTETGLHYAGARYYMSALGRWTTVDPILGEQGVVDLLNQDLRLLAMSPYNYAYNNPVGLRDPDGRCPTCFTGAVGATVGFVGGFGINAVKQLYSDEYQKNGFDLRQASAAGAKGGIFGGAVGLTAGTSLIWSTTAGAAGNTIGGAVERKFDGNAETTANDVKNIAQDIVTGGLGGMTAGSAAKVADDLSILVQGSPASTATSTAAGEVVSQATSLPTDPIMQVVTGQLNPAEDLQRMYGDEPVTTNDSVFNE